MPSILSKNKLYVHLFYAIYCLIVCISLSACHIYRNDLRQGTYLKSEQLSQLKPGLTKKQVQKILGTSSLEPIAPNRMDYYYSFSPNQDGITEQQHIILYFNNNDELNHYEGNVNLKNLPTTSQNLKKYPKK
jgi:outer membrane protein assembly factor BamE